MADAQSFPADSQGAHAEAIVPAVSVGAAAETQGAAAETRERRSGGTLKYVEDPLPWPVRKGFRVKAFGLAALQMWVVLAGVVILDPLLNHDDCEIVGPIVLSLTLCASLASLALLWVLKHRHPWNFLISLVTTLEAIVVWSLVDTLAFNDAANVCIQMLGIMAGTLSMMFLMVQIPLPQKYECVLLLGGILCAWLASFACDLAVISFTTDIPAHRAFMPGFGTLTCVLGLMALTGKKMADGNPDAFMYVVFCIHFMQFLILAIPILLFVIRFGMGGGGILDGVHLKKPKRTEVNGETSNLPPVSQSV